MVMNAATRKFAPNTSGRESVANQSGLADMVCALSNSDLAALEDELDFYAFTGVPSQRMLQVMDRAGVLDNEWRALLDGNCRTIVPTVIKFKPMATHRRAQSRRLPLQALPALPETA